MPRVWPKKYALTHALIHDHYYHRNVMNEFMGLITGMYEAKRDGFLPGGLEDARCSLQKVH